MPSKPASTMDVITRSGSSAVTCYAPQFEEQSRLSAKPVQVRSLAAPPCALHEGRRRLAAQHASAPWRRRTGRSWKRRTACASPGAPRTRRTSQPPATPPGAAHASATPRACMMRSSSARASHARRSRAAAAWLVTRIAGPLGRSARAASSRAALAAWQRASRPASAAARVLQRLTRPGGAAAGTCGPTRGSRQPSACCRWPRCTRRCGRCRSCRWCRTTPCGARAAPLCSTPTRAWISWARRVPGGGFGAPRASRSG